MREEAKKIILSKLSPHSHSFGRVRTKLEPPSLGSYFISPP